MDSVSCIIPVNLAPTINQEEFDNKFAFIRRKSDPQGVNLARLKRSVVEWLTPSTASAAGCFSPAAWMPKYTREDLMKDVCGQLYIAALLIPQGLASGLIAVQNPTAGLFALLSPQLLYVLFGSCRHTSIGSLSLVSFLVCGMSTKVDVAALTFVAAVVHFMLFAFPLSSLLALIPDHLLSGFSLGLFIRLLLGQLSQLFVVPNGNLQCVSSLETCLQELNPWPPAVFLVAAVLLLLAKHVLNPQVVMRVGFSVPHEFLLLLIATGASYLIHLPQYKVPVLGDQARHGLPNLALPRLTPFWPLVYHATAVALFAMCTHLKIAKKVAMEKMHKVNTRKELFAFASFEVLSSLFGCFPVSSSPGNSQINMETTKFTLVSNAVAALLILAFSVFLLPYLHYLPLCVIAAVALTSFHGLFCDVGQIRRLWNLSKADFLIWLSSFFLALFSMDDFSLSFFLAVGIALLTIVHRVQKPTWNTMVRLTEGYFGEENRYEGDGSDSILKVFRFEGPLVFANAERFYANVQEIAHTIKGQLGLGIGTRTASLRSQAGGKDMMSVRTSLLIGNDPLLGTGAADSSLIKVLVLDFAAIPALDTVAIATLTQLYFELQEESIRVFFACVNASCRDQLELGGFFERVGRTVLFPTLNDAFSAARGLILPIHMSVSLNGCRDVIALSTATSRHEELGGGGGGGQEGGETVVVPPTPPANQLQPQPALV